MAANTNKNMAERPSRCEAWVPSATWAQLFSHNLPTPLVLLRATALYLQEVQAAYGVSRVSRNYCAIKFRPNDDGVLLQEATAPAPNAS